MNRFYSRISILLAFFLCSSQKTLNAASELSEADFAAYLQPFYSDEDELSESLHKLIRGQHNFEQLDDRQLANYLGCLLATYEKISVQDRCKFKIRSEEDLPWDVLRRTIARAYELVGFKSDKIYKESWQGRSIAPFGPIHPVPFVIRHQIACLTIFLAYDAFIYTEEQFKFLSENLDRQSDFFSSISCRLSSHSRYAPSQNMETILFQCLSNFFPKCYRHCFDEYKSVRDGWSHSGIEQSKHTLHLLFKKNPKPEDKGVRRLFWSVLSFSQKTRRKLHQALMTDLSTFLPDEQLLALASSHSNGKILWWLANYIRSPNFMSKINEDAQENEAWRNVVLACRVNEPGKEILWIPPLEELLDTNFGTIPSLKKLFPHCSDNMKTEA